VYKRPMDVATAREAFAAARVAHLATVGADQQPHLVPIVFALRIAEGAVADTVYTAVDQKPKRTNALRRLANLAANPQASVLVDHYADDWTQLWWVRADGIAHVLSVGSDEGRTAVDLLTERYEQYRSQPPPGPVIAIEVIHWRSWSAG